MKKIKYCLTLILLTCSAMSFAQFSNGGGSSTPSDANQAWKGLRFGYDLTSANGDNYDGDGGYTFHGFNMEYVHAFNIAKIPLFIETGGGISFARYKENLEWGYDEYSFSQSVNMLSLHIPVNLVYKIRLNDKISIKPFTGFYLRANLMGKYKLSDGEDSEDYNVFDKDDMENTWNRVQFGWQIGTTLDINKFNIGIGYALDFNELAEGIKCGIFSAKVGINF